MPRGRLVVAVVLLYKGIGLFKCDRAYLKHQLLLPAGGGKTSNAEFCPRQKYFLMG